MTVVSCDTNDILLNMQHVSSQGPVTCICMSSVVGTCMRMHRYMTYAVLSQLTNICTYVYILWVGTCMHTYMYAYIHVIQHTLIYCNLKNNWNISTVFNGFWYQYTTEPRRSVFHLFCKSQGVLLRVLNTVILYPDI